MPERLRFHLNGTVHGNLTAESLGCKNGRCALVEIGAGVGFVSVTGGNYSGEGGMAYCISCDGCNNALIQNLTAQDSAQGNIHFYSAGPAIEIRNVDSSGSNHGIWSQTPSRKVLITDSYFHHNFADGVDLDSMSQHVMIRNNIMEHNHRCGFSLRKVRKSNIYSCFA